MIPESLSPIANHLWQSTLFAGAAWLLTLALRKNSARVRHWLWVAAALKFLVPFSFLIALGTHVPWRAAQASPQASVSIALDQVSQPFALPSTSSPVVATVARASMVPAIVWTLWVCGLIGVGATWLIRWRRIAAAVRTASPVDLDLPIRAICSPAFIEPGIFGVFRPVLLLPEGIFEHLTPEQWNAVVAHELCHVRRRDNLIGLMQMFVETIFWFHPLTWWIGKQICQERERACDEEVVKLGNEPRVYARGILKVCELYLESPMPCVAGISGSNLRMRIEAILNERLVKNLNGGTKALLAAAGLFAIAAPIAIGLLHGVATAQSPDVPDWQTRAGGKMAFEVASVKPSREFRPPNFPLDLGNAKASGGRLSGTLPLVLCVAFAYKLLPADISTQLPKSFPRDGFDIEARAPGNPTKDQMRLMMQSLLADRFKLRVHFETHEGPVFALTLVRPGHTGPKLHPHADGPACPGSFEMPNPFPSRNASDAFPPGCGTSQIAGALIGGRDLTMEIIAQETIRIYGSLAGEVDRPVVDQTGLKGRYDFTLQLQPGTLRLPVSVAPPNPDAPPADPTGTPFLNALRDQLGLKLVSSKGPIRKLVIDHAEPPSAN
jgi:uncharacterized protein (TIGR03435 family)